MHYQNLLLIGLMALLTACGSKQEKKVDSSAGADSQRIMLSPDGVGPLNASTPFNMHQVTLAFPDYSVTEYQQFQEGESSPIIRVSENGNPLILINPDLDGEKILSIEVISNKIGNVLGHEIGTTYDKIYSYDESEPCMAGSEELTGTIICLAPKNPNLLYLFDGTWNGPEDEVPPAAILASWQLVSVVWKPK